jgi:WD40 repeat protein
MIISLYRLHVKINLLVIFILLNFKLFSQSNFELTVQKGHASSSIISAKFSHDGKYVISTALDNTLKLWDSYSGILIYTLVIDRVKISCASFSTNDQFIILKTEDDNSRLYETKTGKLVVNIFDSFSNNNIKDIISPDAQYMLRLDLNRNLYLIELKSQNKKLLLPHAKDLKYFDFIRDGNFVVTHNGTLIKLWNTGSAKLFSFIPYTDKVDKVFFPKDFSKLIVVSKDLNQFIFFSDTNNSFVKQRKFEINFIPTGIRINKSKLEFYTDYISEIYDLSVAMENRAEWGLGNSNANTKQDLVKVSPDFNYVAKVYDFNRMYITARYSNPGSKNNFYAKVNSIDFSPDSKRIVIATEEGKSIVLSVAAIKELAILQGYSNSFLLKAKFSPKGKFVGVMTQRPSTLEKIYPASIKVYDWKSAKQILNIAGVYHYMDKTGLFFSPDDRYMIIPTYDQYTNSKPEAKVFDLTDHKELYTIKFPLNHGDEKRLFSDNGRLIFDYKDGQVIETTTSKVLFDLYQLDPNINNQISYFGRSVYDFINFSPNGKYVATAYTNPMNRNSIFRLWSVGERKIIYENDDAKIDVGKVDFTPDSKYAVVFFGDSIRLLSINENNHTDIILPSLKSNFVGFSPDGKYYSILNDSTIKIFLTASGKIWFQQHISYLNEFRFVDLKFSEDHNHVIIHKTNDKKLRYGYFYPIQHSFEMLDLKTRIINESFISNSINDIDFDTGDELSIKNLFYGFEVSKTQSGKKLFTCIVYDDGGYSFIAPDKTYLSLPPESVNNLFWRNDLTVISFKQMDIRYNRPDKILTAIGDTDISLIKAYRNAWEKRIKNLHFDTSQFQNGFSIPEVEILNRDSIAHEAENDMISVHFKGSDHFNKLDRFNVWVNGVPVYGRRGLSLSEKKSKNFEMSIVIKLSNGINEIEASLTNENGIESFRKPLVVNYSPPVKETETVRFIGIGIDRFANSNYDLQYSVKDIRDLSLKLKEKFKSNVKIDTLFNKNVTVSNIKALKKKLLQTTEDDKVIIAYSGHGLFSKDYDYFLSTYPVDFDDPKQNGLPYDELEDLLDSIPARKKLMLIDACHSGEVDKEELMAIDATADSMKLKKGVKVVVYKKNDKELGLEKSFELMQSLFANVGASTGATIIAAAAGTQFALERGDLRNGVFTYSILEVMNKYSTMTIGNVKKIVSERVQQLTNGLQKPMSRSETIVSDWNLW